MTEKLEKYEPFEFSLGYFIALYFVMAWVGLFPSVLVGYWFFITFPFAFSPLYLLMMVPLFLLLYGIALLSSLIATKTGIWIVHKRTPPIPGSYPLTMENPQTRAFVLKGNIKHFGRWLYYFFPLQFLRVFWLRRMGHKIGKHVKLGSIVIDDDFVEIGDNAFLGRRAGVVAHFIDHTTLTLNPISIGKNCIFENMTGAIGCTVGDNSIIKRISGIFKGQICRGNALYQGIPIKKVGEYADLSPEDIEAIKREIRKEDKINYIKEKNAPIKINEIKLFFIKLVVIIGGCLFGLITPFLYSILFQAVYNPTNYFVVIFLLALIPVVFVLTLAFFISGTAIFIKLFLVYYDRKVEIPEGTYDLDDPRAKIFKIKYMLRMFGLRIFHGSLFKITDTFVMRLWGNVVFGKNVKMEDAIVDPQYLEVGDYSQIAVAARIHTHDIINDRLYIKKVKIGKNVIIGTYTHIKPGVEIADGSITAGGAWFRKNRKCKRPALWLGKPAFELPVSVISKSARLEGKYVD